MATDLQAPFGSIHLNPLRLYIAPMLKRFHLDCPEVVLDLALDDAVVEMVAGDYDVAIRIGEVIERDLVAVKLGPDLRQVAVASHEYLDRHGEPQHPRDLLHHRCVRWRWPGRLDPYNWEFYGEGAWFEVAVDGPLIVNSKELGVRAAKDGVGIAFAVESQIAADLQDGRLVVLLDRWSEPFSGHHLCYPKQRRMAPAVRAFIEAVRAQASD